MLRTTSMRTLQCAVKHKLMDVNADIRLFYPSEAVDPASIEKGNNYPQSIRVLFTNEPRMALSVFIC